MSVRTTTTLQPGETFAKRYVIESVLGVGGFARVYLATQSDLDRQVAIKVMHMNTEGGPPQNSEAATRESRWLKRFKREAKVISNLRDPHTITVYDYGHTDGGMAYMVFEYIDGLALDEVIEKEGTLESRRVINILRQCLSSLQEAHATGILHRDIKPANIMLYDHLGRKDQVKILDFGICKPIAEQDDLTKQELTREGNIIGTPRYMAPEQLLDNQVGPPADLYSLGLVAFELLSGQKAVSGDTTMTIISNQISPAPLRLPESMDISPRLRRIIETMLARKPSQRYATADVVLSELEDWDEPIDDKSVRSASGEMTTEDADRESTTEVIDGAVAPRDDQGGGPSVQSSTSQSSAPHGAQTPQDSPPQSSSIAPPEEADEPSDEQSKVAVESHRGHKPPLIGFIVALVLVGVLSALLVFGGDEEGPDDEPAQPETASIADDGEDADDDSEEGAEIAGDETPGGDDATASETHSLSITTTPSGAAVSIDDRDIGSSPLQTKVEKRDLPLEVVAVLDDGRTIERQLEAPTASLYLEFEPPEPSAEDESRETTAAEQRAEAEREAERRAQREADQGGREHDESPPSTQQPAGQAPDSDDDTSDDYDFIPLD